MSASAKSKEKDEFKLHNRPQRSEPLIQLMCTLWTVFVVLTLHQRANLHTY